MESRTTLFVDAACQSGIIETAVNLTSPGRGTLRLASTLLVDTRLGRLGELGQTVTGGEAVLVIDGGTGAFEGAFGTGTCEITAVSDDRLTADTSAECTLDVAVANPVERITSRTSASAREITEGLASPEGSAGVQIHIIYRNNSAETLSGLRLSFRQPRGASMTVAAAGEAQTSVEGEHAWDVPDLDPGEVGRFHFTVRLTSAPGIDQITIAPELLGAAQGVKVALPPVTLDVID